MTNQWLERLLNGWIDFATPAVVGLRICDPTVFGPTMPTSPACPQCTLENTYVDGTNYVCADCGYEWAASADAATDSGVVVRDSNGNVLVEGDTVVVIKDLKVKGSSIPLKQGTVIKNIRLVEDDAEHIEGNSDKIKGLVLKTCFLRKA
jgi:protein PhnA